jgi:hypothetical protein
MKLQNVSNLTVISGAPTPDKNTQPRKKTRGDNMGQLEEMNKTAVTLMEKSAKHTSMVYTQTERPVDIKTKPTNNTQVQVKDSTGKDAKQTKNHQALGATDVPSPLIKPSAAKDKVKAPAQIPPPINKPINQTAFRDTRKADAQFNKIFAKNDPKKKVNRPRQPAFQKKVGAVQLPSNIREGT